MDTYRPKSGPPSIQSLNSRIALLTDLVEEEEQRRSGLIAGIDYIDRGELKAFRTDLEKAKQDRADVIKTSGG